MLGRKILALMLTAGGSSLGVSHPLATRSTRHRWDAFAPPVCDGRVDWKTMNEPSLAIAGDESYHCPENETMIGADQWPALRCASMMTEGCPVGPLRVK